MPMLAGSGGVTGGRVGDVRGEVVVKDVVFPVNAARGEMATPPGAGGKETGARAEARGTRTQGGEIDAGDSALERRAHPRITLAGRSGPVTSRAGAKSVPPSDEPDR